MKPPAVANVIEFPSNLIMANRSNVLAAFAIVFLASLSLSSAFARHNLDIPNVSEKHLDHGLQPLLREKRQKEAEVSHLRNNSPLELEEEPSELKPVYERRTVYAEEAKEVGQTGQNDERKNEEQERSNAEPETSNDIEEEDAQDDVFSYRSMHDLIQALILADEEDIAERLQQLRENATKSETLSNLPKRQAVASAAAAATSSSGLLGANLWDVVPIADLDTHSCEVEAFSHGHLHVSGTIVHEFFCELRKFWHYGLIVIRNLKSELTLGPLVAGEVIGDGIFARLFHHTSHLFHTVIREPHHLLILSDIIRDAVPFPSIIGAFHRVKLVFFKVLQFGFDLIRGHVRHLLAHFFSHPHLGVLLSERLLHLGSILPLEETVAGCGPIVSTAASAATATATTTTATATATASGDDSIVVPDYRTSLAEVLSSFRGFYDGYHASGVPHLVRIGVNSFSASSVFPRIRSYLSSTPFSSYFGCGPVEQSVATVTTSSASSSVGIGGPVIGPVINPVIEPTIAPSLVAPVVTETASSSASATATATATVAETQPLLSVVEPTVVPSIIPCESTSSNAAAVATAAAAAAVAASPVVSGYQTAPLVQSVPTLSPAIVSNTVSESSSVAVAAPEIAVPAVLEGTAAAASTVTSAAASSAANVVSAPVVERVPITLPLRRYRPRPVLSTVAPAVASAAAAASASTSTGGHTLLEPSRYRGLDLDIDRRIGYSPIRSRISPAVLPSSAVTSSAAASTSVSDGSLSSAAAVSSSASSVSPGGFSFVLPREQIVSALGYDYLLPGDIIAVNLKNRSTLFGRVLDASSPITFSFLRPKLRASLLRHGGRVWNLLPRDFRDPECVRKFNNPLLLRHSI